jgi:hypothetical protein
MVNRDSSGRFTKKNIFDYDTLSPHLKLLLPYIDAGVALTFDVYEHKAESEMRTNAPWTDRTGNARNGLMAKHDAEPMVEHTLTLFHTMPYGLWLEVRFEGKFAIIGPTMFSLAPSMTRDLTVAVNRAVERLRAV